MKRFPNGHFEPIAMNVAHEWSHDFMSRINKRDNGCHEWAGTLNKSGYGIFHLFGRTFLAHRLSYLLHGGDLGHPVIMHSCDNPCCVNPDHLAGGTYADNMADMDAKGRRVHGDAKHLKDRTRHPRSKPVMTPDGVFANSSLAADHYGITRAAMSLRLKNDNMPEFHRL